MGESRVMVVEKGGKDKSLDDSLESKVIRIGRRQSLHLHINRLQTGRGKLSDEDIGLAYVCLTLTQPKECYLTLFKGAGDGVQRETKKCFQEGIRLGYYDLLQEVEVEKKQFDELRSEYISKGESILHQLPFTFSTGIEHEVYRLVRSNTLFEHIAGAVKEGAARYHERVFSKGTDKRFIEYNRIWDELKRI